MSLDTTALCGWVQGMQGGEGPLRWPGAPACARLHGQIPLAGRMKRREGVPAAVRCASMRSQASSTSGSSASPYCVTTCARAGAPTAWFAKLGRPCVRICGGGVYTCGIDSACKGGPRAAAQAAHTCRKRDQAGAARQGGPARGAGEAGPAGEWRWQGGIAGKCGLNPSATCLEGSKHLGGHRLKVPLLQQLPACKNMPEKRS